MEIDDDSAGCYSGGFRMHLVPKISECGLDGKRTEGKEEQLGAEQSLRVCAA